MKSRSIRIDPALQQAAEAVLSEDESLSQFIETAVRQSIAYRQLRSEFLARGLASRDEARRTTGRYFDAQEVLAGMDGILQTKHNGRHSD
jgi:predicted transcriptional regulator